MGESTSDALNLLESAGAAAISHPGGTLLAHLRRTADLLDRWWAPGEVVLAGLCHAAYGTDGFDHRLVELSARTRLAATIGPAAEGLVYLYASCDRRLTYPELATGHRRLRNRFTDEVLEVPDKAIRHFMELTFANELDIAQVAPDYMRPAWPALSRLFQASEDLVSPPAWAAYLAVERAMCGDRGLHGA